MNHLDGSPTIHFASFPPWLRLNGKSPGRLTGSRIGSVLPHNSPSFQLVSDHPASRTSLDSLLSGRKITAGLRGRHPRDGPLGLPVHRLLILTRAVNAATGLLR